MKLSNSIRRGSGASSPVSANRRVASQPRIVAATSTLPPSTRGISGVVHFRATITNQATPTAPQTDRSTRRNTVPPRERPASTRRFSLPGASRSRTERIIFSGSGSGGFIFRMETRRPPQFVYRVAIPARRRVRRNPQRPRNLAKRQLLPNLEMGHRPLLLRQSRQLLHQPLDILRFIRTNPKRIPRQPKLLHRPPPPTLAPHQIHERIVRRPQQIPPRLPHQKNGRRATFAKTSCTRSAASASDRVKFTKNAKTREAWSS